MLTERYNITDQNLRELIAIKIIYDLIHNEEFDKIKTIELLKKLSGGIKDTQNREILASAINKASINLIGSPALASRISPNAKIVAFTKL